MSRVLDELQPEGEILLVVEVRVRRPGATRNNPCCHFSYRDQRAGTADRAAPLSTPSWITSAGCAFAQSAASEIEATYARTRSGCSAMNFSEAIVPPRVTKRPATSATEKSWR